MKMNTQWGENEVETQCIPCRRIKFDSGSHAGIFIYSYAYVALMWEVCQSTMDRQGDSRHNSFTSLVIQTERMQSGTSQSRLVDSMYNPANCSNFR